MFVLLAGHRQRLHPKIQRAEFSAGLYSDSPEREGSTVNNTDMSLIHMHGLDSY